VQLRTAIAHRTLLVYDRQIDDMMKLSGDAKDNNMASSLYS